MLSKGGLKKTFLILAKCSDSLTEFSDEADDLRRRGERR